MSSRSLSLTVFSIVRGAVLLTAAFTSGVARVPAQGAHCGGGTGGIATSAGGTTGAAGGTTGLCAISGGVLELPRRLNGERR